MRDKPLATPFPLSIALYAGGLPITGAPIQKQSLGGSESALYFMSRELVRRGHEVTVFAECPDPGKREGVTWWHVSDFQRMMTATEWDLFIACRQFPILTAPIRSKMNWLWMHDMPSAVSKGMPGSLFQTDQVLALSRFHVESYLKDNPCLGPLLWQTRNGVDLELLHRCAAGVKKNPKRLIYASRPERGLDFLLLKVWPELLKLDPDLELAVCTYNTQAMSLPPELQQFYRQCEQIAKSSPHVTQHGNLTKGEYYQLLASSALMTFPTSFCEISCINALETMGLGVPIVTTDAFALQETVPYGKIPGLPKDPEYLQQFVDLTWLLLNDQMEYRRRQKQGREWVEHNYQWKQVAVQWEARALQLFTDRFEKQGQRICERLLFNSDVVVAKQLAEQRGYEDLLSHATYHLEHHHEEPEVYFQYADPRSEWEILKEPYKRSRFHYMAEILTRAHPDPIGMVLDIGCGSGAVLSHLVRERPDIQQGVGVDFSAGLIEAAWRLTDEFRLNGKLSFRHFDFLQEHQKADEDLQSNCDVVVAAEILEHIIDYRQLVDACEYYAKPGGTILLTVPSGPWEAMSYHKPEGKFWRDHVHHFERRDLIEVFGQKKDFQLNYAPASQTPWGELVGWWFVSYSNDPAAKTGKVNVERKLLTTRPRETIAACLIAKNEEDSIRRCLKSIREVVDEIWVWDCGSTDRTMEIVKEFEGLYWPKVYSRQLIVNPDSDGLGNFGAWRNQSISETNADWLYWIDCDEILVNGRSLRKYANHASLFNAYVIKQNHVQLRTDKPIDPDVPQRLFRNHRGYRFIGCIHEMPHQDLNVEIEPSLQLADVDILHYGYLTAEQTRRKCIERNLPLLRKDRLMYPARDLGPLLVARDYVNLSQLLLEESGGVLTDTILGYLRNAVHLYLEHYADPTTKYHNHALKSYQIAVRFLGLHGVPVQEEWGQPFEFSLINAVGIGGLNGQALAQPTETRWFSSLPEFEDFMTHHTKQIVKQLSELQWGQT